MQVCEKISAKINGKNWIYVMKMATKRIDKERRREWASERDKSWISHKNEEKKMENRVPINTALAKQHRVHEKYKPAYSIIILVGSDAVLFFQFVWALVPINVLLNQI